MTITEARSTIFQSVENALNQLRSDDVNMLKLWLSDCAHQLWDAQIETSLESGKLDVIIALAEVECTQGLSMPL